MTTSKIVGIVLLVGVVYVMMTRQAGAIPIPSGQVDTPPPGPILGFEPWLTGGTNHDVLTSAGMIYFRPQEFGQWWGKIDDRLLQKLDQFRGELGRRVIISPHPRAIGRTQDGDSGSQHYYNGRDPVRGIDIMLPDGPDLKTAYEVAKRVGFTGIGIYPQWQPYQGMHLDVRRTRLAGFPAKWSFVNGTQVAIERGFV